MPLLFHTRQQKVGCYIKDVARSIDSITGADLADGIERQQTERSKRSSSKMGVHCHRLFVAPTITAEENVPQLADRRFSWPIAEKRRSFSMQHASPLEQPTAATWKKFRYNSCDTMSTHLAINSREGTPVGRVSNRCFKTLMSNTMLGFATNNPPIEARHGLSRGSPHCLQARVKKRVPVSVSACFPL